MPITPEGLELFLNENYFTFLLIAGLLIVIYAYRDVHYMASRNFLLIILVIFLMCVMNSLEAWAMEDPGLINIRTFTSVTHYILQPLVLYLELLVIIPEDERETTAGRLMLAPPLIANTVIYLIAPFTGELVFNFDEDYIFNRGTLGYTIYVVTFYYLLLLTLRTIRTIQSGDRRKGLVLLFLLVTGVLTGVLEAMYIVSGYIDEAFALGAFLYYMYLVTAHEAEMQNALNQKELELSQQQITLMRQQIRPHFVFNSLHIIKSLIRRDQDKAVRSLEDFSDYLRANFDVISSDTLIPFEEELSHIDAYVALALADESKNITVVQDIQERYFRLPPLTIEPLVENAILHGLSHGGTCTISTKTDENGYIVTVSDDGTGFDESGAGSDDMRIGTGLENVRTRLAKLCGGTLDIRSSESGTDVTVRIPWGKEQA